MKDPRLQCLWGLQEPPPSSMCVLRKSTCGMNPECGLRRTFPHVSALKKQLGVGLINEASLQVGAVVAGDVGAEGRRTPELLKLNRSHSGVD